MIDLVKNFHKIEKPLTEKLNGEKQDYFGHKTFTNLDTRVERLKKSNNMEFGNNRFIGKLGFPIQKSVSMSRKHVFDQNYRNDQLFYIKPTESTDPETARNIEDTLSDNLRRTRFRSTTFNYLKLCCAEYGTAVCYSTPGILLNPHMKTQSQRDQEGNIVSIDRVRIAEPDIVIQNKFIDLRCKFQDPDCCNPEDSNYHGHIERWDINEYINYVNINKEHLITKNVKSSLEDIKKSGRMDQFYKKDESGNLTKYPVDITIHYSTANITGNEDNVIPYYFVLVDGKIIRIEADLFDENLVPYSILKFIPRNDVWWGNCDGELQLPHENAINTLIGLKLGNAIRAEDQIILYPKGAIDKGDWDNRRVNSGLVPIELPDNLSMDKLLYKTQFTDDAVMTFDSMMREINSSRQGIGSDANVNQRVSKTGPLANTTATAVGAMQEQADIKEGSYMENFNYGMINIARANITHMQQFFPESFSIVSSPGKTEKFLDKQEILGSADVSIRTALTNNKAFEAQRYINAINTILNWRGTQDPAMMKISLENIVKSGLHRMDLGDINELYNENQQPPQIGAPQPGPPQEAAVA